MQALFQIQRRIAFAETDMAGITHFANYFRYMEEAEHAFLRSRGLSVAIPDVKGTLGFPKLEAQCNFQRPLRHDEIVDIAIRVDCDGKTLTYQFEFTHANARIAAGTLRVAFCRFPPQRDPYAIPIPDGILTQLFP